MSLAQKYSDARPYKRSPELAEAMARAEGAAVQKEKPAESPWVARTRTGCLVHREGPIVQPGPLFDAHEFNALPVVD